MTFGDPRAVRFRMAAPAERDEVAGRVIPADAAMDDVMNLQAVRVVAQRAAVAIAGIDGLSCLVRDGCGQVSSGLQNRSPLSFDTRAATRLSRVADRPLAKPLTGVLSTEFSTNERGLDSEDRRQQHPSRARRTQAFGCCCALRDDVSSGHGTRRATSSRSAVVSVAARGSSSVTRFSRSYAASSSRTSVRSSE